MIRVHGSDPVLVMPGGIRALGVTDTAEHIICFDAVLRGPLLRKVLIHEITHAWISSYNYVLSLDHEEFLCDFVASNADDILSKADELLCMGACRYLAGSC